MVAEEVVEEEEVVLETEGKIILISHIYIV